MDPVPEAEARKRRESGGKGGGKEGDGVKAVGKKTARGETAPRTGKDESKNSIDNPGKKRSNHRGARSQSHDKLTCNQIRRGRIGGDTAHDRADRGRGAVMHTQAPECFALPEGDKSGTREGWARRPRQKKTVRIFLSHPLPLFLPLFLSSPGRRHLRFEWEDEIAVSGGQRDFF